MKVSSLAAALSAALCTVVQAESLTTGAVVVSATRVEQSVSDAVSSVSVVQGEDLTASGADTLPEMLKDVPAARVVTDGTPGVQRIALRGENASRTLLLVDGERIDDSKTKSGAPYLINPFFVERVEILRGPSSVLYGSDALGGIVNVITKDYSELPFSFNAGGLYNGAGNGFSEYLNATGTVDKLSYKAGVFGTDMGDRYLSSHERMDNTSYRQKGSNAALAYAFNEHVSAELTHEYFDLTAHTASDSIDPAYQEFSAYIPKWQREKTGLALNLSDLNEVVSALKVRLYTQSNDKDFTSSVRRHGPYVYAYNEQDTYGGNLQGEFSLGESFFLIAGVEARVDKLDSDSGADIPTGETGNLNVNIVDRDLEQENYALYALLENYLTDSLTLQAGLRYNYVRTDAGSSHVQAMGMNIDITSPEGTTSDSTVVGSLGLNYTLSEETHLRASWAQGYRAPNLQELYLTTFTGEMQRGNPDLKEERSDTFEVGINHESGNLSLDAALFYSVADDYIDTVYLAQSFMGMRTLTYRNISKATTWGAELSAACRVDNFEPYASLSALRRRYDTGTEQSYDTGTPTFAGRAGVKYTADLNGILGYVDVYSRFASATDNASLDGVSYFANSHIAGYATYNLSFGVYLCDDMLKIYGAAENLSDKDYRTSELIREPGRFFSLGFDLSY